MGLYETLNCLGQSETLMLVFSENKFKVRFIKKLIWCFILPRVSYSPVHPYAVFSRPKITRQKCHRNFSFACSNSMVPKNLSKVSTPRIPNFEPAQKTPQNFSCLGLYVSRNSNSRPSCTLGSGSTTELQSHCHIAEMRVHITKTGKV
jgi:hypothetical protein